MGILGFLFGKNNPSPMEQEKVENTLHASHIGGRLVTIESVGFIGPYKKSDSGKWLLAWADSDSERSIGGHRASGHGRYVLCDAESGDVVVYGKNLERPNRGEVSDCGIFSLEDWHFGNELSGTLHVFSPKGDVLFKHDLTANILNSGLASSGRYAVCQTANSDTDDGNKLSLFDIEAKTKLFSVTPQIGWADAYGFDEEHQWLLATVREVGTFRYDFSGKFLDGEQYQAANLESDEYARVIRTAEAMLKESAVSMEVAKKALNAVVRARKLGAEKDDSWKPIAFKAQGLAHEVLGEYKEALALYDAALSCNPQIGVKRKADSLRKKLS